MKDALKALIGLVLGQNVDPKSLAPLKGKPVTADAAIAAADGGLMEMFETMMDDAGIDDAKKVRLLSLLSWADEAANADNPVPVIGYVKKKIGKGQDLENTEGYMLLAYLDAVWGKSARLDEEPMDAPGAKPPVPPPPPPVVPPPPITVNVVGAAPRPSAAPAPEPKPADPKLTEQKKLPRVHPPVDHPMWVEQRTALEKEFLAYRDGDEDERARANAAIAATLDQVSDPDYRGPLPPWLRGRMHQFIIDRFYELDQMDASEFERRYGSAATPT
jgi:hypothetical protein